MASTPKWKELSPEEKRKYGNRETYRVEVRGKEPTMPAAVIRQGGVQDGYGAMIGAPDDAVFTTEFVDTDGDMIDDRRQYRAGLPDSVMNPGAMMGDQYVGTKYRDLGEDPGISREEYKARRRSQRMATEAIGNAEADGAGRGDEAFDAARAGGDFYSVADLGDFNTRATGAGGTYGRGSLAENYDFGNSNSRLSRADLIGLVEGDQNWFDPSALPGEGEEGYLPDDLAAKKQLIEFADAGVAAGDFVSGTKAQNLKDSWMNEIANYVYVAPEDPGDGDPPPVDPPPVNPPPVDPPPVDPPPVNPPPVNPPPTSPPPQTNTIIVDSGGQGTGINQSVSIDQNLVQEAIATINMGDYNQNGAFSGNVLEPGSTFTVTQNQTAGDAIATNNGQNNAYVVQLAAPNQYTGSSQPSKGFFGPSWPFG